MSARNYQRARGVTGRQKRSFKQRTVLLAIADRTSGKDLYWESRESLTLRLRLSRRPAPVAFAELCELGIRRAVGRQIHYVDMMDVERDGEDEASPREQLRSEATEQHLS